MRTPAEAQRILNRVTGARKASRARKAMMRARSTQRPDAPKEIRFVMVGPPQPKQRARKGKGGHWYTPAATASYEKALARVAWSCTVGHYWPTDGRYRVTVAAYFPDARRRDADNVGKSVLDALNGVLFDDDSQVDSLTVARMIDPEDPRTDVRVEVL